MDVITTTVRKQHHKCGGSSVVFAILSYNLRENWVIVAPSFSLISFIFKLISSVSFSSYPRCLPRRQEGNNANPVIWRALRTFFRVALSVFLTIFAGLPHITLSHSFRRSFGGLDCWADGISHAPLVLPVGAADGVRGSTKGPKRCFCEEPMLVTSATSDASHQG